MINLRLAGQAFGRSSRFSFVLLAPICIGLGVATAWVAGGTLAPDLLVAVLLAGVFGHISVNLLNEYQDFKSGLDFHTVRTPFSGGTGFLPQVPEAVPYVLFFGLLSLLLVCVLGGYLLWHAGWMLFPLGLLGVVLVLGYTGTLNRMPLLCWCAPGLGFGAVMVLGTHYALSGDLSASPLLAALVVFFMVNNLLLLNQFPDLEADRKAGRRHILVRYGVRAGALAYGFSVLAIPVVFVVAVGMHVWPAWSLLALLPWLPCFWSWRAAWQHGADLGRHHGPLAANVLASLLVPAGLGLTLLTW